MRVGTWRLRDQESSARLLAGVGARRRRARHQLRPWAALLTLDVPTRGVPSPARVREVLSYDPDTGTFTWLVSTSNRVRVGDRAGWKNGNGYLRLAIDGCKCYGQRLAWVLSYGTWPVAEIDHINGDPSDNRLVNLREATRAENGRNLRRKSNNTSGTSGVSFCASTGKWQAQIMINRRNKNLGLFANFQDAIAVRKAAEILHFGEFART